MNDRLYLSIRIHASLTPTSMRDCDGKVMKITLGEKANITMLLSRMDFLLHLLGVAIDRESLSDKEQIEKELRYVRNKLIKSGYLKGQITDEDDLYEVDEVTKLATLIERAWINYKKHDFVDLDTPVFLCDLVEELHDIDDVSMDDRILITDFIISYEEDVTLGATDVISNRDDMVELSKYHFEVIDEFQGRPRGTEAEQYWEDEDEDEQEHYWED